MTLTRARACEALEIAREHFKIGQQVVRPQHGLRAAQMGVAGNDGVRIVAGAIEKRLHQRRRAVRDARSHLAAQPQAQIERDLLIAAAAGVDLIGQRADAVP